MRIYTTTSQGTSKIYTKLENAMAEFPAEEGWEMVTAYPQSDVIVLRLKPIDVFAEIGTQYAYIKIQETAD